jgi:alkylation response protein AidB-like acyl-CoA dehydrogenase
MGAVETAQRLADELLVPAAVDTDRADVMPRELLDELAAAGLYALGAEADFATSSRSKKPSRAAASRPRSCGRSISALSMHSPWRRPAPWAPGGG